MKKLVNLVVFSIIISMLLLLCSCGTSPNADKDENEEEISEAADDVEDEDEDKDETEDDDEDKDETEDDAVDEDYVAPWSDYLVVVHGVEFNFPMTFEDFENRISQTNYEIRKEEDKEREIYHSFSTSHTITYLYHVRDSNTNTGESGLTYTMLVYFQNLMEDKQMAKDCMVIGFEVTDGNRDVYDEDIYFTEAKLAMGQEITKSEIENLFGKSNGWITEDWWYEAGSFAFQYPRFCCQTNKEDNTIKKLMMINFNDVEE